MSESFPRQQARTRRFTLGTPRAFTLSPDGTRVVFLRTRSGDDPVTCLWELDVATGNERLVADPRDLGADEDNLPPQERARRERVRETAGGIVSYATDSAVNVIVFALAGQVFVTDASGPARSVPTRTPALDPRPDPSGTRVAYVHDGTLRATALDGEQDLEVASELGVTYGLAEFVAAEEMDRTRGYWWSPDGNELLAARVDESPVQRWHIADPANPDREPTEIAYPAAGTPNADVTLHRFPAGGGTGARLDLGDDEYLVTVNWGAGEPLVVTQPRDQKTIRVRQGDRVIQEDSDPDWTDIVPGVPARTAGGALVWAVNDPATDTRRLTIDGEPVTPEGLQLRAVCDIDGDTVLFTASREPTEVGLWSYQPATGVTEVRADPGVHTGIRSGGTTLTVSRSLEDSGSVVKIDDKTTLRSLALRPNLVTVSPVIFAAGERGIRTAVLLPSGHQPGTKLPVLMAPYGGPHAQQVLASRDMYLVSQWFAEQGFAVVTADGRGTPGRGPAWDRAIAGDFAGPVLEDQVTALHAAADRFSDLDLDRVGIRGWSFGGYLSALAVLRRPDVFRAAVAGAPVTDWRLYDTHYTERYLGMPPAPSYDRSSLRVADAGSARPLLLIHGTADDNVVFAHTLRLSSELLAAGYPHSVLPLSGVTHMTPQEVVAENLLLLQARFLKDALG
jgi:dipeptidyl-peptidase-4